MHYKRKAAILFLLFTLFLFVHLAYGLVVREPYPSFMMPGFSRIDNDGQTYKLIDRIINLEYKDGTNEEIQLQSVPTSVSKIALSRMIDLAFFNPSNTKTENSAQRRYYQIIENFIGTKNYREYVTSVRYPNVSQEDLRKFESWLIRSISNNSSKEIDKITVLQTQFIRDFKSGEIIESEVLDSKTLSDD